MRLEADESAKKIAVHIPLTSHTGKVRIKQRNFMYEYGIPYATRKHPFAKNNYVEWQISYYISPDNQDESSLPNKHIDLPHQGKKVFYELSEYLYYFYSWGAIPKDAIQNTYDSLKLLPPGDLIANHHDAQIQRTDPLMEMFNNVSFQKLTLQYPQLVHEFAEFNAVAEISIREKQRAVGTQPMLYLCFPITELEEGDKLIGRIAEVKETRRLIIDSDKCGIILELLNLFGMLSHSHQADILAILESVLKE